MRQKYQMIKDDVGKILTIREYAIIDKNLKNVATSNLREMDFFLVYEETYDGLIIKDAVASKRRLMQTLRTENFFPIENYAVKIAEAVADLYDSEEKSQVELFFDDKPPVI